MDTISVFLDCFKTPGSFPWCLNFSHVVSSRMQLFLKQVGFYLTKTFQAGDVKGQFSFVAYVTLIMESNWWITTPNLAPFL